MDHIDFTDEAEFCTRCGHQWAPHVLIATLYSPQHGGMVFCHEPGCLCQATWSLDEQPMPYIPDDAEVERLRNFAQHLDHEDEAS